MNYGELLRWAKLKDITMKAGEFKDTGSPTREMTPAEREYLQSLIDNMHTQFIQAVAEGRHAKEADIRAIADGKVWTGEQAFSMKLVDQVADFEAAVKDTAKAVGISGEPTLVRPQKQKRSGLDLLFRRRFRLPAHAGEASGAAGRLLLPVEVGIPAPTCIKALKFEKVIDNPKSKSWGGYGPRARQPQPRERRGV